MTPKLKGLGAISGLWLGSFGGAVLGFFTIMLLARSLGKEQFGLFSTVQVTAALVGAVVGMGVPQLWLQVFGRDTEVAKLWILPSLKVCAVALALGSFGITAWGVLGPNSSISTVLFLLAIPIVSGQLGIELVSSKLQVQGRYLTLAWWQSSLHLCRFGVVVAALYLGVVERDALFALGAFALVGLVMAVAAGRQLYTFASINVDGPGSFVTWPSVLSDAWPFGAAVFLNMVYYQSNILIVNYLDGSASAGIYSLAFNVMAATYLLPTAIFQKYLLPKIHNWIHHDPLKIAAVFRFGSFSMLSLGIIATLIVSLIIAPLTPTIFGGQYTAVVGPLRLLSLSAPFMFIAIANGSLLATTKSMKAKIFLMLIVAVFNVTCNYMFIGAFGVTGAALATVFSNVLLAVLYSYWVWRKVIVVPMEVR